MNEQITSNLKLGIDLYNEKKFRAASQIFFEVAQYGNCNEATEANLYLGKIALRSDKEFFWDAQNYLDYVIIFGDYRQKEQAYFELATTNRLLKNYKEAISLYLNCLEIFPNDAYVLADLANLYLKLGYFNEAEEYYYRLLSTNTADIPSKTLDKKRINANIAYLGLSKVALKKGDINSFLENIVKVNPVTINDREQKDALLANLDFIYEKYPEAIAKLYTNLKSRIPFVGDYAKEKVAVLNALSGNTFKSKRMLERIHARRPLTKGSNITLASIYYQEKKYKAAYDIYIKLSYNEPKYLVNALKCVIHYNEFLAIKIVNKLLLTDVEEWEYQAILIYLSKKYCLSFAGFNYDNLSMLSEKIIALNFDEILSKPLESKDDTSLKVSDWDKLTNYILANDLRDFNSDNTPLSLERRSSTNSVRSLIENANQADKIAEPLSVPYLLKTNESVRKLFR